MKIKDDIFKLIVSICLVIITLYYVVVSFMGISNYYTAKKAQAALLEYNMKVANSIDTTSSNPGTTEYEYTDTL